MKFYGKVGFWEEDVEISPDVWSPSIVEKTYKGDVLRAIRKFQPSSGDQNDTFTISNRISIIGDLYARENYASIKYIIWKNRKWKVSNVEENYPRLILELGGVYNENVQRSETPIE